MLKRKGLTPAEHRITVRTDYGHIEIVNLKDVWINCLLGTYNLMYQDDEYRYNCIYWSDRRSSIQRYKQLKEKLLDAYNRGDSVVEL